MALWEYLIYERPAVAVLIFVNIFVLKWLVFGGLKPDYGKRGLNVIVTGSTKGIGLAMVREFLRLGDNVIVCSRSEKNVMTAVAMLQKEFPDQKVFGFVVDITKSETVEALAAFAKRQFGNVDIWINNAGMTQPTKSTIADTPEHVVRAVIECNLLGTLNCDRVAINLMKSQPRGGHVFNMDGAGSNGMSTPSFAVYGATKAGFPQLLKSLAAEVKGSGVGVHCLSPGIVVTDLLMASDIDANGDSIQEAKVLKIFNILAERPKTVAEFLVPSARAAAVPLSNGQYIKFLTGPGAGYRFMTAMMRTNRLFTIDKKKMVATDNESGKAYPLK